MMRKSISILAIIISSIALLSVMLTSLEVQRVQAQIEDVSNFTGVHVRATALGTATPLLYVRNDGSSKSVEIENSSGTPVWSVNSNGSVTEGGAVTAGGNLDMNTNTVLNIGAAGTDFSGTGGLTLADALTISSGGASVAGTLDVNDAVDVDGSADEAQLAVTGYTTQTTDLVQLDGGLTDVGGGTYANADGDNDVGIDGDLEVNGNGYIDTDLTVDDTLNIDDTDSALTGAQTITPTYSYLQVSPTAVLTVTLGVPTACDGDLFIIHNLVSTNTVIVDTGATVGGGNITMAQDDVAGFICGDSAWVELFSPDNS